VKRRRTFCRFNDAQPAAGTSTQEEQPPAAAQTVSDERNRARDLPSLAGHGAHDARILAVHESNELFWRESIEVRATRMGLLGREAIESDETRHRFTNIARASA
jgi:hypothetical protein